MVDPIEEQLEFERYVRSAFRKAVWAVSILFLSLVLVGVVFDRELMAVAKWTEEVVGVAGLAAFVFLADTFTLPLPPDLTLIVVANSPRREDWVWVVPLLGCVSAAGGVIGWWIGTRLSGLRWVRRANEHLQRKRSPLFQRYGVLAVALGALTPVPFSITCWTVGALGMPFRSFVGPCLLRIPRFLGYYWLLANAAQVSEWLRSYLTSLG